MRYKKWYNVENKTWCILAKKMIYVGKLTWVVEWEFKTQEERDKKLKEIQS